MSNNTNPLDILKRLDVKQNVTIRVIDEPTGKVIQEHVGHNAATNSLLTGIAHYLMGDGVLNQGQDTLSMWVPQYISLGTMGLTSQDSDEEGLPIGLGSTLHAPENATEEEKELNVKLRFQEYVNQAPGFGADGYDANDNNNREWFGLGLPYSDKPDKLTQDFFDANAENIYPLSTELLTGDKSDIQSVTIYPDGVVNQDENDLTVSRVTVSVDNYEVILANDNQYAVKISDMTVTGRLAIIYAIDGQGEAVNCELITRDVLRSQITYRSIVPEVQSDIPNTLDVIYAAFVSTGALANYRKEGEDYIYITEAGLWSKPYYNNSGDNGLLAGYRITPADDNATDVEIQQTFTAEADQTTFTLDQTALAITLVMKNGAAIPETDYHLDSQTNSAVFNNPLDAGDEIVIAYKTTSWKDMNDPAHRREVQESILRIGKNQVAQVIWKLQLGGLQQLNGLRYIYPSQYPQEVWEVWSSN